MKRNMSNADRIIRTLIAVAVAVLYFTHVISGTLAIVLGVIALVFLASSLVGQCPGYSILGISTNKDAGAPGA
jgi:hypothetical protein